MTQNPKTITTNNNRAETGPSWRDRIEFLLLISCSILLAGRCMIFEVFPRPRRWGTPLLQIDIGIAEVTAMTVFSGLIVSLAFLWLLLRWKASSFTWRNTSLVVPLFLFALGGGVSYMAASNRHAARIDIWTLLSVMLLGILLIQLLNVSWRRRFLLCVLAATGVAMAHRCWEQNRYEFTETQNMYRDDPNRALLQQGIPPGTYAAQQYANRLASRDIRGYFGVSNTAAAFFILSIAATTALILDRLGKGRCNRDWHFLLAGTALLLVQCTGLWLTQSKGGIAGFLAAAGICALLWRFRKSLLRHWRKVFVVCVLVTIAAVVAVAAHGMAHDRLPTNSMWVRWQYWKASAAMIADHWFTGVGPHNFGDYYPRYMDPAAPEVIQDPHSLPISIWSQWGMFGFLGLVWTVMAITIRLARPFASRPPEVEPPDTNTHQNITDPPSPEPKTLWGYGILIAVGIMVLRLAVSDLSVCESTAERNSVWVLSFLIPSAIWLIAFAVFLAMTRTTTDMEGYPSETTNVPSGLVILVLGCGLLGFILHNCIDFSFFRPGVAGFCFACIAAAISSRPHGSGDVRTGTYRNLLLTVFLLGLAVLYHLWLNVALPVARSQRYMDQALTPSSHTLDYLETAQQHNPEDPESYFLLGTYKLRQWYAAGMTQPQLFQEAIDDLSVNGRVPADYSYPLTQSLMCRLAALQETTIMKDQAYLGYKKLLVELFLRARVAQIKLNATYAAQAIEYAEQALQRNPNDSCLLIYYADLLICLGPAIGQDSCYTKADQALQTAIENENAFLEQQKQMYLERKDISHRLEPHKIGQVLLLQNLLQRKRSQNH